MPHLACLLATAYDRALAAVDAEGLADPIGLRFAGWLAAHWAGGGPASPVWPADAVSVDGRGVLTMRWYTLGRAVLGYAPGARGCYVVPIAELPPPA